MFDCHVSSLDPDLPWFLLLSLFSHQNQTVKTFFLHIETFYFFLLPQSFFLLKVQPRRRKINLFLLDTVKN